MATNEASITLLNGNTHRYVNGKLVESSRSSSSTTNSIELRETGKITGNTGADRLFREAMDRRTAEYGPLTLNGRKKTQPITSATADQLYTAFVAQCKLDVGVDLSEAEQEALRASKPTSGYTKFVESLKDL